MDTIKNCIRILLLLSISTIAACLAYPVIWSSIHHVVGESPDRVFRRIWQFSLIIGLIGWGQEIGLQNPSKVGFTFTQEGMRNCVAGISVSWFFLGILTVLYFYLGYWKLLPVFKISAVAQHFIAGMVQGALIAGMEEYIFRGLIFLSLALRWGWISAAVFSSLIFSCLHFVEGKGPVNLGDVDAWYSGFLFCGQLLHNMTDRMEIFPAATGLFLIGFIMCFATIRTGNLWYAAGLHGGWIWYFVVYKTMVEFSSAPRFLTGGGRLFDGVIPIIGMFVIFPVTWWLIKRGILYRSTTLS